MNVPQVGIDHLIRKQGNTFRVLFLFSRPFLCVDQIDLELRETPAFASVVQRLKARYLLTFGV